MIRGIEHTALSVSNLENSIQFYCETLGMELVRIIENTREMRLGEIVGLPGCAARIAHLASGGPMMLELFEYSSPRGRTMPDDRTQADVGPNHFGLRSTNVLEDYRSLQEHGVEFVGEPVEFRPGVWVCYFYGPDREVCELRQS